MAFVFGTASRIWLDGKQAACAINELKQEVELDEAEVTTLCSTLKDFIPGLGEVTVEMEGYFDTNTASPATTLESIMDAHVNAGDTFPVTFAPEGGADTGDPAYLMNGFLQTYAITDTVDEAAGMEATFRGTTGLSRGFIVERGTLARTVTGNAGTTVGTDVLDNGALTSNGGVAVLQVFAVTGTTPSATIVLQHSVDNVTYADLATFSAKTAIDGEYLTVAAGTTVNRYLRASWTISGSSPSFNFNLAFKRS